MGVYIKGLNLSQLQGDTGINCRLYRTHDGELQLRDYVTGKFYEVVNVSSHGELIEKAPLIEIVKNRTRDCYGGWNDIECVITGGDVLRAPIIIPQD